MGNPINAVPLPPEVARELPAGTLVYSFDGELVFRGKNLNHKLEPRTFSLMPIVDNPTMYERRWLGAPIQDTYVSVELLHGHAVTMYFFYFPIAKSNQYRTAAFAAMSWSTHQWLWVTHPRAVESVFNGEMTMGRAFFQVALTGNRGLKKLNENSDKFAALTDRVVAHLRYEMNKKLEKDKNTGRL